MGLEVEYHAQILDLLFPWVIADSGDPLPHMGHTEDVHYKENVHCKHVHIKKMLV